MKKTLSVLLAIVMVLSSMTVLVSATEPAATPGVAQNAGVNAGHIYYSENFDDEAISALEGDELADALGWELLPAGMTMKIVDGQLQIVYDMTVDGEPVTEDYVTPLVVDEDMVKNALTIQYKIKYQAKADAAQQDDGAYLSLKLSKDPQNFILATPVPYNLNIPVGDMVTYKNAKWTNIEKLSYVPEGMTLDTAIGTEHTVKCVLDPHADGVQVHVDGIPMTNVAYTSRKALDFADTVNEVFGKTMELVVKPGVSIVLDDLTVSEYAAELQITELMANAAAAGRYQWIELYNPNTTPVNVYDYCVVIRNGVPINNGSIGDEYDIPNGTTTETKVDADGNVYKVTSNTYATYNVAGASTIGYFTPGTKEIVVNPAAEKAEDRIQKFDSPALEDGVLNPGETAIVLFPDTAISGNNPVTDEDFRAHMTKLGLPEDVDLYVCDNSITRCKCMGEKCDDLQSCPNPYKYPFKMINVLTEFFQVALMKVNNTATEAGEYKPVAIGKGVSGAQQYAYYENYVVMSSKPNTSGTADLAGFPVYKTSRVADDSMPLNTKIYYFDNEGNPIIDEVNGDPEKGMQKYDIYTEIAYKDVRDFSGIFGTSAGLFSAANDQSFEITYSQLTDASKSQKFGWMVRNANEVRQNAEGRDAYYSPGYVPPTSRDGVAIKVTSSIDGAKSYVVGKRNSDYVFTGEAPAGYQFEGILIGDSTTPVNKIPASMITADAEIEVTFQYKRLLPIDVYAQVSEPQNGVYTLRLLGVTDHIKCQSLGFKIEMSWTDADGVAQKRELYRDCKFVYDKVTTVKNGQSAVETAESLGGQKLFAYHIDEIPADQENIVVTVTPYYVKGYSDQNKVLAKDCAKTFVLNDTPAFGEGNYDSNKDSVDFGYDGSEN